MSAPRAADDRPDLSDEQPIRIHYALVVVAQVAALTVLWWLAAVFR